jgi:hypothetical protein
MHYLEREAIERGRLYNWRSLSRKERLALVREFAGSVRFDDAYLRFIS